MASDAQTKYSKKYSSQEMESKVLNLLEDFTINSRGLNINQISTTLGINRNTTSKWLNTLKAKNLIISRKDGVSTLFYKADNKNILNAGPYVLTVEYFPDKSKEDEKIAIKSSNDAFINRINELRDSIVGKDIFSVFPFKNYKDYFQEFLLSSISSIGHGEKVITENQSFTDEYDKKESFLFKIFYKQIDDEYVISFQDLTLLRNLEEQLVNSDSISKILNLITDKYITIQTQDYKVIKANQTALDKFNGGKMLIPFEPISCLDFFSLKNIAKEDFIGQKAIKSDKSQSQGFKIDKIDYTFTALPIKSIETDLKGFILIVEKIK